MSLHRRLARLETTHAAEGGGRPLPQEEYEGLLRRRPMR
jgi:hypothetical protein